jgi:hypothetical protein
MLIGQVFAGLFVLGVAVLDFWPLKRGGWPILRWKKAHTYIGLTLLGGGLVCMHAIEMDFIAAALAPYFLYRYGYTSYLAWLIGRWNKAWLGLVYVITFPGWPILAVVLALGKDSPVPELCLMVLWVVGWTALNLCIWNVLVDVAKGKTQWTQEQMLVIDPVESGG